MLKKNIGLLVGILFSLPGFSQQKGPVVIIMADQLRADVLGEMTPHIRQLQAESVDFERTYCASPLCAPSRAAFFTGLFPNRNGSKINPWSAEDEVHGTVVAGTANLYTLFEKSWDSYHVGKQHLFTAEKIDKKPNSPTRWTTQADYNKWLSQLKKTKPGGRHFKAEAPELVSGSFTRLRSYSTPKTELYPDGLEYFLDHYITTESIKAIKSRDKNKPLLLNAMYLAPHPPFHIPDPYFSMYKPGDYQVPENVGVWYPGQSPFQMYSLTGFLGSRYTREQWTDTWAKYLGLVKLLDDEVGRLIQVLKEEGLYDEAMIIFTSDHGEMLGSHSLWQKMCMYEESVRVPLFIKFPRSYKPSVTKIANPVSLVDVLPTLLDYFGVQQPTPLDGVSLLPLVAGKSKQRAPVFIQYDGNGSLGNGQRCLVRGNDKLIVDTFKDEYFFELYDVKKDPMEKENLAFLPQNREKIEQLFTELQNIMKKTGDRLSFSKSSLQQFYTNYVNASNSKSANE